MAVEEAEQALTDLFASRSSNAVDATAGKPAGAMLSVIQSRPGIVSETSSDTAGLLKSIEGQQDRLSPATKRKLQVLILEKKAQASLATRQGVHLWCQTVMYRPSEPV